ACNSAERVDLVQDYEVVPPTGLGVDDPSSDGDIRVRLDLRPVTLHLDENMLIPSGRQQVHAEVGGERGQVIGVGVGDDDITFVPIFLGDLLEFFLVVHDLTEVVG